MYFLRKTCEMLAVVFRPVKDNAQFFFFMYVTAITVSFLELPRPDSEVYPGLWLELFVDLYVLTSVIMLFPRAMRCYIRILISMLVYLVSIADVFCWEKFRSTLNPSMLLLVGETDSREAGEFLSTYLAPELLWSGVGVILLIALVHLILSFRLPFVKWFSLKEKLVCRLLCHYLKQSSPIGGFIVLGFLVWGIIDSVGNKCEMVQMFRMKTVGEVEHELTTKDCAQFYLPVYRLAFSVFSNRLASQQIGRLIEANRDLSVDSCSFRSPNIVLIIGESFGKHHSQQYGYFMPTTPRQMERQKTGLLVPFGDVVSPWNLTSFVFKNVFSLHVVGQKGEWCDYPLFPALFRKAGYHVSFVTNQFLSKAREAVYDFSGGFFLNNPELSAAMFDTRNDRLHRFDRGLIDDYDNKLEKENKARNLIIFHLMGQHVAYHQRYPKNRQHFKAEDYKERRPELNAERRATLAEYDNAVLYNDSIVDQIIRRFENKNAVVIYMPDHGEECYEGRRGFICRNHSAGINYDLARYEFEIPFWVYCSPEYVRQNPDLFKQIVASRNKRFMTDALPHMLLYLAGVATKAYHAEYNILSPRYNEHRERKLKNTTNYDALRHG